MTSNRKADLMSLNAIAPLYAPSHCYDSASLRFAEIVTMAGRLLTVVSAGAPSFFKRSSAPLPTRIRSAIAINALKPQSGLDVIKRYCSASRSPPLLRFGFAMLRRNRGNVGSLTKSGVRWRSLLI